MANRGWPYERSTGVGVAGQDVAHCSCGSVKAVATGEPEAVVACHCLECQRRTGSPFGVGAYYPRDRVSVSGPTQAFSRRTDSGETFTSHFCIRCGTTVYWCIEEDASRIGVAVGAFADPEFPGPS